MLYSFYYLLTGSGWHSNIRSAKSNSLNWQGLGIVFSRRPSGDRHSFTAVPRSWRSLLVLLVKCLVFYLKEHHKDTSTRLKPWFPSEGVCNDEIHMDWSRTEGKFTTLIRPWVEEITHNAVAFKQESTLRYSKVHICVSSEIYLDHLKHSFVYMHINFHELILVI